jgi:hypothetical protein
MRSRKVIEPHRDELKAITSLIPLRKDIAAVVPLWETLANASVDTKVEKLVSKALSILSTVGPALVSGASGKLVLMSSTVHAQLVDVALAFADMDDDDGKRRQLLLFMALLRLDLNFGGGVLQEFFDLPGDQAKAFEAVLTAGARGGLVSAMQEIDSQNNRYRLFKAAGHSVVSWSHDYHFYAS